MTRLCHILAAVCLSLTLVPPSARADTLAAEFADPPMDCRPHTRWWWMGNALREEDIVWQLDQMRAQGIGGVEQITMEPVYTKGNHEYLSPEYFALLRFAVEEAAKRGMEFSVNFGGPGWIWGGKWVPEEDRSQVLLASMTEVDGPAAFPGPLPEAAAPNPNDLPRSVAAIGPEDRLVKVVAGRLVDGRLAADSLTDLSDRAAGRSLAWDVPEGRWRVMAFWLTRRDNADAVDHLNPGAMARYCETLGAQYEAAVGGHFGKTIESFFSDSFEVPIYRNGLYWTGGLFERFRETRGYDLVPLLPALWYDVEGVSPGVRHDVNALLHEQGMEAFFQTFLGWCERHGVRGRIQPYGFVTDTIAGAGAAHLPEMEITAGEKDAVPWFDTRVGPRAYVASGAHLYGRNIVTTEAFTYLHWEPYRETLAELKAATDAFLWAGANKVYNHGFIASPERENIVPTRGFFAAIRISPENIWWPHYRPLADYTARCCRLLREGRFTAEVAVYSPLANQWALSALNARKWTREFDFGALGELLMANGHAFDLVNDDVLQHRASLEGDRLRLGEMRYRALILPDITAIPLETLRTVEAFARGGGRVLALERVPDAATGLRDQTANSAEVRRICAELFRAPSGRDDTGRREVGAGETFFLETVMRRDDPLDRRSAALDPFLKALRSCAAPEMDLDPARAGRRANTGLACLRREAEGRDIYFVTNLQEMAVDEVVGFRTARGVPWDWDPHTGARRPVCEYARDGAHTRMRLRLAPFASRCVVFEGTSAPPAEAPHVEESGFAEILDADAAGFTALADHNGPHAYRFHDGARALDGMHSVVGLPAPFEIGGGWTLQFDGDAAAAPWPGLRSWTDDPVRRHFSGRARYAVTFTLPAEYFADGVHLRLSLGAVGNVAEVRWNGAPVGVHWRDGQTFALDGAARPGENTLEVDVTNTLINCVSGLDAFPGVPEALRPVFGDGLIASLPEADALRGFEPLPPSGLLGPVRVTPLLRVRAVPPPP